MATRDAVVTVSTTAQRIDTAPARRSETQRTGMVTNVGGATVYVGGASVTAATGTPVEAGGGQLQWETDGPDQLWVVTASGTSEVRVIELGV